ncbi:response regulator [Microvirgula aerodenitrificans]|uniref:response regulator n=1 Tax=Microvirgula aerodenitrificans TaxID=57480 RepID=UPI00248E6449|nr:response regulator [Microvirgula aerodenitrificans]
MNIVLADDHPIVMIGIRNALQSVKELRISGEADSASGLIRLLESETPDILITDFYMPGSRQGDGIGLVTYVQRHFPAVRLIVLTMLTNAAVLRTIVDVGVQGLLLKSTAALEIIPALHAVMNGGTYIDREAADILCRAGEQPDKDGNPLPPLTTRELEVVRLFVTGNSVSDIARLLNRSVKTVSTQKRQGSRKLGVSNDRELYEYARLNGLL